MKRTDRYLIPTQCTEWRKHIVESYW